MYNDVLRLGDAQTLLNCSLVQVSNRINIKKHKQKSISSSWSNLTLSELWWMNSRTQQIKLRLYFWNKGHPPALTKARATFASHVTVTSKTHTSSALSHARFNFRVIQIMNSKQLKFFYFSYFDDNYVLLDWTHDHWHCSRCINMFY